MEIAAAALRRAGHTVGDFEFPESANIAEAAAIIWMSATAEEIDFYRGRVGRDPQPHELEALTWACVALAKRNNAIDYVRARRALTAATRGMAAAFEHIDVLLLPTPLRYRRAPDKSTDEPLGSIWTGGIAIPTAMLRIRKFSM